MRVNVAREIARTRNRSRTEQREIPGACQGETRGRLDGIARQEILDDIRGVVDNDQVCT